jgi:predicted DNA-binding transcriptional regulator AlpA
MLNLLSTPEAARLIGCSPGWLSNLRSQGGGPTYVRLGGRKIAYDAADLRAWCDERRRTSTRGPAVERWADLVEREGILPAESQPLRHPQFMPGSRGANLLTALDNLRVGYAAEVVAGRDNECSRKLRRLIAEIDRKIAAIRETAPLCAPACGLCLHWRCGGDEIGSCTLSPPRASRGEQQDGFPAGVGLWPQTHFTDTCGAFAPRDGCEQ